MEVPLIKVYWSVPSDDRGKVDRMSTPGAATSTQVPKLEKDARLSSSSVAPTAITFAYAAGYIRVLELLLPAAATTTTPRPQA